MAITSALATTFKVELLQGLHNFTATTGSAFKMALYTSSATMDGSTPTYTTSNEVSNSGTAYTTGGNSLTNVTPTSSGTTAYTTFSNTQWNGSTFSAAGCMIYNTSASNRCVLVQSFGTTYTTSNGTFAVNFPTAAPGTAIIQLA